MKNKEIYNRLTEKLQKLQEENEPTNPALWSRAIAAAKAKYDVYPSAYANAFASKWYKEKGGGWKAKSESVNEESYKVAGRPVTLIKGKKANGTDWKVRFQNGKETSLSDVLSLIKPFPKLVKEESVNEAKPQFIKVKDTHQSLANGAMKHMDSFVKKIQKGIQNGEKFEISTIVKMRNILDAIENQYGIKESTPDQVIKDLDKAKNDLLKKVDVLIAKKKKLYSDVDIEAPMSADEKKLDKDIADLFSQINKLVLQKRSVKKESVKEASNDYSPLAYAKLVANGKMSMEKAIKDTGYPFIILAKLVKAFNRNYKFEGNKPVNEKFDNTHLGLLKYAYKDIDKINPADPMYKRVVAMLDKLSKQELKQIADADIKFLSLLAKNRLMRSESHTGDPNDKYVVRPCKNPNEPWAVWEGEVRVKGFATREEAQAFADMKNKEQGLTEGLFQDIMKGVKKGNGPFTLVVIKDNKVVKQANVNTPQAIPANYTSLKKEYPNSRIRVEDSTGKIVFGEASDAEEKDFHMKLDKLVHSTFGKSPDEEKKESVVNESSVEIGDTVFLKSANKIVTVIDRMGRSVTVKTGDGKKIKTIINNIKTLAQDNVNEGSFSEIDIMAREARNFNEFVKEFYKDFRDFPKDKETIKWLKSLYDGRSTDESINEGNAFTGALFKARKEGLTEFEFNGKMYPVRKLEEEEETPIKESKLSKNDLKKIIKEEYHNVKNFMEEKYGFNPDLGKVYSNPAAKPFLKEEEEEVIEEYDVENYEDLKEFVQFMAEYKADINEAEYQGRKVKLGKIMQGDVKKFKVYVKNDKGNVVKVNFGQGGDAKGGTMRIRKDNPEARKSFRARHNCDNPGPRWKARYWSCRKW